MVDLLPQIRQARKLTPSERAALGKDARKRAPRSSHGAWAPRPDRPHPVGLLAEQAADRVADLAPIRYGRMLVSPRTFFRGGALLMASDLHGSPDTGFIAQLCGDAHLMNFGLYQSPERQLVFDINDFDETLRTWAPATCSTRPSPTSPRPTQSRTSVTTTRCARRSRTAAWRRRTTSSRPGSRATGAARTMERS